jgi:peptide/nickel transport system substrate-binding protein
VLERGKGMKVRPAGRIAVGMLSCAVLVGAWLATGANAQSTTSSAAPSKIVLTVGTTSDMESPNVFKACCGSEYEMFFMNYDMLFNFSKTDLTPVSGLATYPPQHNADDTEWTFDIRSGVKWSDGQPLTAEDIVFTYKFIVDNHMGVFLNYLKSAGAEPPSFSAPNATTLVWKSPIPSSPGTRGRAGS